MYMLVQKKGFLLFLCSLIPGAGELYMGFKRRGVSIMILFWGLIELMDISGFAIFAFGLPIVWAYSFFQVHNLKSMPEEVFYMQKDEYMFHFSYILEHKRELLRKYRIVIAGVLILLGACSLFNLIENMLYAIMPGYLIQSFGRLSGFLKNAIAAIIFLGGGIYLALNKEKWQKFLEKEK